MSASMERTHLGFVWRRLAKSARMRVGALALGLFALAAVFAEVIAADAPLLALGPGGAKVFPAVIEPQSYRGLGHDVVAARHAHDLTIWPLVRYGPDSTNDAERDAPPSFAHPLGTDGSGRDLCARLVYGARTAFGVATLAVLLSLVVGALFGAFAGWAGGFWDEALARPIELCEAFPAVVVVAVARALEPTGSIASLVLAVVAVRWAESARLVRAEVVRLGNADFVMAARAIGCGPTRILRRHVLPYALRPLLVSALFGIGSLTLLEAAVSFLGLGTHGSWGVLVAEGLQPGASLRPTFFGLFALGLVVGAAFLCADAAGDALDAQVSSRSRR
jgi:peptide/nickel transport system permease protein